MVKQNTQRTESSSLIWNKLEENVGMKVREFIQDWSIRHGRRSIPGPYGRGGR